MRPPRYHIIQQDLVPAATDGYDQDIAPAYLPPSRATYLRNMLPGRSGKLICRGGSRAEILLGAGSGLGTVQGAWTFDQTVLLMLNAGGTRTAYTGSVAAGASWTSHVISTASQYIGPSYTRLGAYIYGVAAGTTTPVSGSSGPPLAANSNSLLQWNGSTAGGFALTPITHGPTGAVAVTTHLNRLFALGGAPPGGSNANPIALYWTDPGWDGTDTLAAWQDDVTGLTNQIVMEGSNDDYGVGFARVQRQLLILRRRSLMLLSGSSPSNFSVRRVAAVGAVGPTAVAEYHEGTFFMSDTGLCFYDGARVQVVSRPVNKTLLPRALQSDSQTILQTLPGDFIAVLVTRTTDQFPRFWSMMHIPTGTWTDLSDQRAPLPPSGQPLPAWIGSTTTTPFLYDGTGSVRELYSIGIPEQLYSPNSNRTASNTNTAFTDLGSDGTTENLIDAVYTTRTIPLATPGRKANLKRATFDYVLGGTNVEWQVTVTDEYGNTMAGPFHLPCLTNVAGGPIRQRKVVDCFVEADAIQFTWTLSGTGGTPSVTGAEIHDTMLEFEVGQERTG